MPDLYQGSELWDLRLVDPDNRTPVDFDARRRLLREVMDPAHGDFMARLDEGAPKLRLVATALAARARHPEGFGEASGYAPLRVTGSRADHVIAFARTAPDGQSVTLTVAVRWPLLLRGDWRDTTMDLPAGDWRDLLTGRAVAGGEHRLHALLDAAPISLLERCG